MPADNGGRSAVRVWEHRLVEAPGYAVSYRTDRKRSASGLDQQGSSPRLDSQGSPDGGVKQQHGKGAGSPIVEDASQPPLPCSRSRQTSAACLASRASLRVMALLPSKPGQRSNRARRPGGVDRQAGPRRRKHTRWLLPAIRGIARLDKERSEEDFVVALKWTSNRALETQRPCISVVLARPSRAMICCPARFLLAALSPWPSGRANHVLSRAAVPGLPCFPLIPNWRVVSGPGHVSLEMASQTWHRRPGEMLCQIERRLLITSGNTAVQPRVGPWRPREVSSAASEAILCSNALANQHAYGTIRRASLTDLHQSPEKAPLRRLSARIAPLYTNRAHKAADVARELVWLRYAQLGRWRPDGMAIDARRAGPLSLSASPPWSRDLRVIVAGIEVKEAQAKPAALFRPMNALVFGNCRWRRDDFHGLRKRCAERFQRKATHQPATPCSA
ncbi:uncharacterized protein BDZ99DRAFT_482145 [Mytilinidion resinicola]|uniref:Uncharacterized protein n=1 Tax=Mytilinidion resinicola TaxID=574789 RepID=A0A6A6Y3R0_9PEZI|nr:uncharacterized protein BDZ99DRAFT_482145 [Mytilinidion resinicola]KAF2803290.1 hypothetical protein BDZ99DRAFT_482145 [Mytilinidion resinicola]